MSLYTASLGCISLITCDAFSGSVFHILTEHILRSATVLSMLFYLFDCARVSCVKGVVHVHKDRNAFFRGSLVLANYTICYALPYRVKRAPNPLRDRVARVEPL